ncbi:hypothetical protein BJ508DRAFT_37280 [Ascobolus immersus RN42]|uniref:Uncharacterized protein n=1 Tax=Ascobolus immersus RN42 TaxID=1160509 RepID=A0A3N4IDY8_ASCIM|nr:hypothetical protein BJ508DRAFT_37280 [Ascobolus immersus RN42]
MMREVSLLIFVLILPMKTVALLSQSMVATRIVVYQPGLFDIQLLVCRSCCLLGTCLK